MKKDIFINTKSKKEREGTWEYYWPSDVFFVKIKGCPQQRIYGDTPEYGNWILKRE